MELAWKNFNKNKNTKSIVGILDEKVIALKTKERIPGLYDSNNKLNSNHHAGGGSPDFMLTPAYSIIVALVALEQAAGALVVGWVE